MSRVCRSGFLLFLVFPVPHKLYELKGEGENDHLGVLQTYGVQGFKIAELDGYGFG